MLQFCSLQPDLLKVIGHHRKCLDKKWIDYGRDYYTCPCRQRKAVCSTSATFFSLCNSGMMNRSKNITSNLSVGLVTSNVRDEHICFNFVFT